MAPKEIFSIIEIVEGKLEERIRDYFLYIYE